MCGIAGQCGKPGSVSRAAVSAMIAPLSHRGPDASGVEVVGHLEGKATAVFGHTRLAIIDTSDAGTQPIWNEDRSVAVVFNGEIYNFRQLRRDLKAKGHRFSSATDTEVIVHAYEEYGRGVVEVLDGMFAFAIWDRREQVLMLARDRVGKKPLYIARDSDRVAFASEMKGLLTCPWIDSRIAWDNLPELLAFGYVRNPETMFYGIREIPPACYMIVQNGQMGEPIRYWESPFGIADPAPLRWDEAEELVQDTLKSSVQKRLVSDVPLGVLLSGGLDSAAIVACMAEVGADIRTFTVGMRGAPSYDERAGARLIADRFDTQHTEIVVDVDATDLIDNVLWHLDEPMADSSCLPTYLIAREAKKHVTVVLNGDGGDDVFGGYERFRAALLADRLPSTIQSALALGARLLPRNDSYFNLRDRIDRFARNPRLDPVSRYIEWASVFEPHHLARLLPDVTFQAAVSDLGNGRTTPERSQLINHLLDINFRTYLHDDLLVKADRMTMAHSLEARSPFLDRDLIELSALLPADMKATLGGGKRILRSAMAGLLPGDTLNRRKHGFGVPVDRWFRSQLREPFQDLVLGQDGRVTELLSTEGLRTIAKEHWERSANHGHRLWSLFALEVWLRGRRRPPSSVRR